MNKQWWTERRYSRLELAFVVWLAVGLTRAVFG